MATKPRTKFKINDRVLIAAPDNSLAAKHNGQVGRITGFVQDWLVMVSVNGEALRFRPDELKTVLDPY
ncbi:MAG: hypothetical protein WDM70_00585 [Nitrosomonadales bacterium]